MEVLDRKLITYKITDSESRKDTIMCDAMYNGESICQCTMYTNCEHDVWTISAWFTQEGYGNMGIGTLTMKYLIKELYVRYGVPKNIEYIWNGANYYVFDWMEKNFDAICECPLAVQKKNPDDDWLSHIYQLNVDKYLKYFGINI